MDSDASIRFFDTQFQRQVLESDLKLNPFEEQALPYLRGHVLDYGCGLGNLAIAAARQGCHVVALDGSHTAIEHLRRVAQAESLPIEAAVADLRTYAVRESYDAIVSIGLLMFFDCATAFAQLRNLRSHVRPGGVAIVNVLVDGTTYLDMFDPSGHCLFARDELPRRFAGWEILSCKYQDFPAPNQKLKSFVTVVARNPEGSRSSSRDPADSSMTGDHSG
jgi:tellurite methyltransferase